MAADFRVERDSMGELQVPASALWGAQTQRAVNNFPISGLRMPPAFIRALALVKWAAARTNRGLGLLPEAVAAAIEASHRRGHVGGGSVSATGRRPRGPGRRHPAAGQGRCTWE